MKTSEEVEINIANETGEFKMMYSYTLTMCMYVALARQRTALQMPY